MIEFYKTIGGKLKPVDKLEEYTWVNISCPSAEERKFIIKELNIEPTLLSASLDEEEASHIDVEDDQTAIIVDIPDRRKDDEGNPLFFTIPLAMIKKEKLLITICLKKTPILKNFTNGIIQDVKTQLRTRLMFQILYKISQTYLHYLKQIDKMSDSAERQLQSSMKNKALFRMLAIEKSLVYFSTSLKANEVTLQKINSGRRLKLYDEDKELLEDVLIEIKQAIEMCNIYRDILSGTMDAYASIISNNLNIVMKVLTSITILMAIPSMISGIYGMNVTGLPFPSFAFPITVIIISVIVVALILKWRKLL